MKKTAVEWLVEQILEEKGLVDLDIQAAKEMEKQQIIEAFEHVDFNLDDGLHYYNQTFKK